uniref:Uncharacterized protein n=1 Tax=Heterorhabditis bacteriophora TaxID=37862 RepID=A0A1I7X7A4_HETBA
MTIASKNEENLVVGADKIVSTPQSTMSLSRITNAMPPVRRRQLIKSVEDSSQNSKDALKSGNKDNRGKFGSIFEKYQKAGSKRHPLESAVVSRELEKLLREVEQVPGGLEKILRDRGKIPPGLVQVVGTLRQMAKAGKCAGQGSSSNPDPSILKINNELCLSKTDLVRKEITTAKSAELILQEQSRVPPIKKTRSSQQPSGGGRNTDYGVMWSLFEGIGQ